MKKLICILLAAIVLFSFCTIAVDAKEGDIAYAVWGGNVYIDPETGLITDCDESVTYCVIPSRIEGVEVKGVGASAFSWCRMLKKLELPESVKTIGNGAFYSCTALKEIYLPDGVEVIGDRAFANCIELGEIEIPKSVKEIGEYAFANADSLVEIRIPDGVSEIRDGIFMYATPKRVYIPKSVTSIGKEVFHWSTDIDIFYAGHRDEWEKIDKGEFDTTVRVFCSGEDVVARPVDNDTDLGYGYENGEKYPLEKDGDILYYVVGNSAVVSKYRGTEDVIEIPSELGGYKVAKIGNSAFAKKNIIVVSLPESVKEIDFHAFNGCKKLRKINLNNVEILGAGAFAGCASLLEVELLNIKSWGGIHDYDIDWESGKIPLDISISSPVFRDCNSLRKVRIKWPSKTPATDHVASGGNAPALFFNCPNLRTVIMENAPQKPGKWEFYTADGFDIFNDPLAFRFGHHEGRWYIAKIPPYMTIYGSSAVKKYAATIGVNYKTESELKEYTVIDGVCDLSAFSEIPENFLREDTGVKEVILSENLTVVPREAFRGCINLEKVTIPEGVAEIGVCAFADSGIRRVFIPKTVEKIDKWAFGSAKSLREIVIEEGGDPEIDGTAFYDIYPEATIKLPESITSLPDTLLRDWMVDNDGNEVWLHGKYGDITLIVPRGSYAQGFAEKMYAENSLKYTVTEGGSKTDDKVSVFVDGVMVDTGDAKAYIKDGRTMIPMRAIFEALGASVTWDNDAKCATSVKGETEVRIAIGEKAIYKNGEKTELDTAAQLVNERTMVPVRAVAEAFGAKVDWNNETRSVIITKGE